ncbi:MAG: S-layer homology domain-containing protein [Oscillospiraceae bacterium]|nr:S-layer homology domain-containing protein [Oscillospiraceae bacterium]
MKTRIGTLLLSLILLFAALPPAQGTAPAQAKDQAAAACLQLHSDPGYGTEWSLLGLLRGETSLPDGYLNQYRAHLIQTLQEKGGILHARKYTEYARVVLAVTAAGQDARNWNQYALLAPLGEREMVLRQGVNGAIFALLALDCGAYPMPAAKKGQAQATRGDYIRAVLAARTKDGGFALMGETADPDVTAMALTALAPYREVVPGVSEAVEKGLACLSRLQNADGSFSSAVAADGSVTGAKIPNCESTAQVLTALCTLGVSCRDPRFVKGGKTAADALCGFQQPDGSFAHQAGGGTDEFATEQALYALVALWRAEQGKSALYDMTDVFSGGGRQGLPGKRAEITPRTAAWQGKTFPDVENHPARAAIERLAAYGVLNGKSSTRFDPDATMTRAEFSTAVVRALGLKPQENSRFEDVVPNSWYSGFVGTAFAYGITKGTSSRRFTPNGIITREEAAVMIRRTATLCGMDLSAGEARQAEILGGYTDGASVSAWARESVAICCALGWMPEENGKLQPQKPILRSEIAEILSNLLWEAELLV